MTMTYDGVDPGVNGVAMRAAAIVPSDSTDLTESTKGLYVGVTGSIVVRLLGAPTTNVTFAVIPAGTTLPIRVVRVLNTGTGASSIVGLY